MYENQGTENAPSPSVIIPFFVLSATSWLIAILLLFFNANEVLKSINFNASILTITHIIVLGFVTAVMFGALFQMLPVIFLRKIHSEKMAKVTFLLLLIGVIGLSSSFYFGINGLGLSVFGTILNLAVIFFVINIWKTIGNSKENTTAKLYIRTSAIWLLATAVIGLILAINFLNPFLNFNHLELLSVHAHYGIIGWFLFLIIGVSSVLIPMFLLVHKINVIPINWGYLALMLGLFAGGISKWIDSPFLMYFAFISVGIGISLYLYFIYQVYKNRPRKVLDFSLKKTMASYPALIIALIGGILYIAGAKMDTNLSMFYLITILVGFVSTLIMGLFYRTLPFIVWLKVYKPDVGKRKTKLPNELYSSDLIKYQFYSHLVGFALFLLSILLQSTLVYYTSLLFLLGGATIFMINVIKVVGHRSETEEQKEVTAGEVTEDAVYFYLKEVIDPELFVNIVDLGLVYDFELTHDPLAVSIEMTLTSKGCPLSDAIKQDINETLHSYYPQMDIEINIVWEPGWNMDMVSEEGKKQLMGG